MGGVGEGEREEWEYEGKHTISVVVGSGWEYKWSYWECNEIANKHCEGNCYRGYRVHCGLVL